jgi:hypothetical protein
LNQLALLRVRILHVVGGSLDCTIGAKPYGHKLHVDIILLQFSGRHFASNENKIAVLADFTVSKMKRFGWITPHGEFEGEGREFLSKSSTLFSHIEADTPTLFAPAVRGCKVCRFHGAGGGAPLPALELSGRQE